MVNKLIDKFKYSTVQPTTQSGEVVSESDTNATYRSGMVRNSKGTKD